MVQTLYRRSAASRKAWTIPVVLWVASAPILLLTFKGGLTTFNVVAAVLVPGMIFGIWLLTLWSINRYGTVTVTAELLRSGRDSVPIRHLDRDWLERLASQPGPSRGRRLARSANTMQQPGGRVSRDAGRLLGGAFGATLGSDLLTLQLIDGNRVTLHTPDRKGLIDALLRATCSR